MNVKYYIALAKGADGRVSVLAQGANAEPVVKAYKAFTGGKAYYGTFLVERSKRVDAVESEPESDAAPKRGRPRKLTD
jgi:hypothetical protein